MSRLSCCGRSTQRLGAQRWGTYDNKGQKRAHPWPGNLAAKGGVDAAVTFWEECVDSNFEGYHWKNKANALVRARVHSFNRPWFVPSEG